MRDASHRVVRVLRLGGHAARVFEADGPARIAAVFERSLLIEGRGGLVTIGGGSIGSGPLNAIVEDAAFADLVDDGAGDRIVAGMAGEIANGALLVGQRLLDPTGAMRWQPRSWSQTGAPQSVRKAVEAVVARAREAAHAEGLARVALLGQRSADALPAAVSGSQAQLEKRAGPCLAALRNFLDDGEEERRSEEQRHDGHRSIEGLSGLVGLGPGLTPSGDDLLGGVLIMLDAAGENRLRDALGSRLRALLSERTSALSAAFIQAAIEGKGSEAIHDLADAIVSGAAVEAVRRLDAVGGIGHTSGWDAAAGLVIAAQMRLLRRGRDPAR